MTPPPVRPLWAILLKTSRPSKMITLDCDECFSILEYLADTMHHQGQDFRLLVNKIKRHLSGCPDCRHHYLEKLKQLEESYEVQKHNNQDP